MGKRLTNEEFKIRLKEINPFLEAVDEYKSTTSKIRFKCLKDGYIFETKPGYILSDNTGCPLCSGNVVVSGINDLWTTHPEIAKLLKNPEDGHHYSYGTKKKLSFICPNCKTVKECVPSKLMRYGYLYLPCPKCGDSMSFPEKFMYALLSQLNINFIYQLTSSVFQWCGKYRYDFYIPDYNCIIETHGMQHYDNGVFSTRNNFIDTQLNDVNKKELAEKNHIDKYIIIDCRYSEVDYIRQSIINSELLNIFDLSNVDWLECLKYATKSIIKNICDDWNAHKNIDLLLNKYKLSNGTIRKYLRKGSTLELCNYTQEINDIKIKKTSDKTSKPVYCFATNEIFPSAAYIKEKYKIHIYRACKNANKTAYGSKWSYVQDLPKDFIFEESSITLEDYLKEYKKCKE